MRAFRDAASGTLRVGGVLKLPLTQLGLAHICAEQSDIELVGLGSSFEDLLTLCATSPPDVLIAEPALLKPDPVLALRALVDGDVRTVLMGDCTVLDEVSAALRAGAAGYLPLEATGHELLDALRAAAAGQLVLASSVARNSSNGARSASHGNQCSRPRSAELSHSWAADTAIGASRSTCTSLRRR